MTLCKHILYFIIVVQTLISSSVSQTLLENGKFYYIKNALDNSYLRVDTIGSPCGSLGSVGTSTFFATNLISYRWKYVVYFAEVVFLDVEWTNQRLHFNEVTRFARRPHCYPLYRRLNITEANRGLYKVQDIETTDCLMSNGNGSQVSWGTCNKMWSQQWEFVKTETNLILNKNQ